MITNNPTIPHLNVESGGIDKATLVSLEGFSPGQIFIIENHITTIGRSTECNIIEEHGSVSRTHAEISQSGDVFYIRDLNSTNGVYLNGERINNRMQLTEADLITIGTVSYKFYYPNSNDAWCYMQIKEHLSMNLHDGLGSKLVQALFNLRRGNLEASESSITSSLFELRTLLNTGSAQFEAIALANVIGGLRPEIEQRLESKGLKLSWQMEGISDLQITKQKFVMEFSRITDELITNILKHAAPGTVKLAYFEDHQKAQLTLSNPTTGQHISRPAGKGSGNIAIRAERMGGTYTASIKNNIFYAQIVFLK